MPVGVGDVVRVACKMLYDGADEFINVFHVKHNGTSAISDSSFLTGMQAELESLYGLIDTHITDHLVPSTFTAFNVTTDAPIGEESWGTGVTFNNAAEQLPTQVAALISLATGVKRVIGKKYIPGITIDGVTDGNVITAALQASLELFGAQMLTTFLCGGEDFQHGIIRSVGGAFRAFASSVARLSVFTQRRRRPGEGG